MNRLVAPLAATFAMLIAGCGGAPMSATSAVEGPPVDALIAADGGAVAPSPTTVLMVTPPVTDDAGAPMVNDDAAIGDDATPLAAPDAAPDAAGDAGTALDTTDAAVDAAPVPDAGAAHDAAPEAAAVDAQVLPPAALCCVGTGSSINNVQCGAGVGASCRDTTVYDAGVFNAPPGYFVTTFNSADCFDRHIGDSCLLWPHSYASPDSCRTGQPCCGGIVQACQ